MNADRRRRVLRFSSRFRTKEDKYEKNNKIPGVLLRNRNRQSIKHNIQPFLLVDNLVIRLRRTQSIGNHE